VPQDDDFKIDLTFTGRDSNLRVGATIAAVIGLIFVVATMTTNLAEGLLPMTDEYLQVMIPIAPDGGEPLSLKSLQHEIKDKTISVSGEIANRTDQPVSGILAVVQLNDTTGRFPQTQEIPIMPPDLPPQGSGAFMAMATLQEKPGGYLVKFRFLEGPFIPHKDERAPSITIVPKPAK